MDVVANRRRTRLGQSRTSCSTRNGARHDNQDGVTIAKGIELEDPYENMGAQLVKEVASQTNDVARRRTTTRHRPLAQRWVKEGLKNVAAGSEPHDSSSSGIQKAVKVVVDEIKKLSVP